MGGLPVCACSLCWNASRVWFEGDADWYEAVVRGFDRQRKLHNLWYPYDEEVRTPCSAGSTALTSRALFRLQELNWCLTEGDCGVHQTLRLDYCASETSEAITRSQSMCVLRS